MTFWIALNDIDATNGAMQLAPGTQRLGERLPVQFGSGKSFMTEARPSVESLPANPEETGFPTVTYALKPACGVHDALVWHGSTPNTTAVPRLALVLRYVAEGTLWLGETRMRYADIRLEPGGRVTADHFPAADA